ncbi:LacI family DNA-binding transcriptional regulator [Streptomyces sp. NPDC049597]|uniref:LacI family DNA-binding transcriptional regulator n=1 Tax=Streptomyces sp. NPDC049597 TaxID=3155276 RepID=UPI0034245F60
MARITYQEIARHAGVSTATVSRVLAGRDFVREELAERVRASAAELGYRPNKAARALRTQRADAVGLLISDVENPFFASVARAVEAVAADRGYAVLLCNTAERLEQEDLYLDLMIAESVAGVIIAPSTEDPASLGKLVDTSTPTVTVDRWVSGDLFDSVTVDHRAGARALVDHLLDHGHRHIAAVVGTTTATPTRERLAGCREALEGRSGARLTVCEGKPQDAIGVARTLDLGRRVVAELLDMDGDERPTALFCGNNLLSEAVVRALRERDVRIPQDIALVGFDDLPLFDLLEPPLTVAAQPIEEIGRTAAELLFARIAEPDRALSRILAEPRLRIRRSCGSHP